MSLPPRQSGGSGHRRFRTPKAAHSVLAPRVAAASTNGCRPTLWPCTHNVACLVEWALKLGNPTRQICRRTLVWVFGDDFKSHTVTTKTSRRRSLALCAGCPPSAL